MNSKRPAIALALMSALLTASMARAANYLPTTVEPPVVPREFRGVWVATVRNIDWPSKPGLPVKQQQDEMLKILDRAAKLNLNAIVLQVRPTADTLYESKLEPWAAYLSGTMGVAPEPFYDPLAFAVDEAHKRGLELHAWFNPYRVAQLATKPVFSTNHVSQTHPELVRKYGDVLWLDPGEKEVQQYSLHVIMDVVRRYDIDGVVFDDYFYPYKEQDAQKKDVEFPDNASWEKYGAGGKLSREDWRRENVNTFVQDVYGAIKLEKPWVKFGISPFGIWQPGFPPQIKKGMNARTVIYADSLKWLKNGWVDYFAPQLYWSVDSPDQPFPVLWKWWASQNPKHRNVWAALFSGKVDAENKSKWQPDEIVKQIKIIRAHAHGDPGEILFSMKTLMENRNGLAPALVHQLYSDPALVPPSPWLEAALPAKPELVMEHNGELHWGLIGTNSAALWLLQTRIGKQWRARILPGSTREETLTDLPDIIALTAIDRCGMASPPAALKRQ